jgi:hypothetical protein
MERGKKGMEWGRREGIEGEFIQTKTLQQSHFYVI